MFLIHLSMMLNSLAIKIIGKEVQRRQMFQVGVLLSADESESADDS